MIYEFDDSGFSEGYGKPKRLSDLTEPKRLVYEFDGIDDFIQIPEVVVAHDQGVIEFDIIETNSDSSERMLAYGARYDTQIIMKGNNVIMRHNGSGAVFYSVFPDVPFEGTLRIRMSNGTAVLYWNGELVTSKRLYTDETPIHLDRISNASKSGTFVIMNFMIDEGEEYYFPVDDGYTESGIIRNAAVNRNPDGSNLVINGEFDSDVSSWVGDSITQDGGRARFVNDIAYQTATQTLSVEEGCIYRVSCDIEQAIGATCALEASGKLSLSNDGFNEGYFFADAATIDISMVGDATIGDAALFDNIVVHKVDDGFAVNLNEERWKEKFSV